jgi:hypothetical protein
MRSDVSGYSADEPSDEDLAHIEAPLPFELRRRAMRYFDGLVNEVYAETAPARRAAAKRQAADLFGPRPARRSMRQRSRSVVLRVLPGGLSDEPVRGDASGEAVA